MASDEGPPAPPRVLVARGLTKRYAGRLVLDGLDLALRAGEVALLTGPNGSGKTTLLRVLATLERPDAGSIAIGGVDALDDGARARAAIGWAGHDPGLYPALTVRENLAFAAGFARGDPAQRRRRVADALDRFGLLRVADERAQVLSRGTRQRATLARALLPDPALLLLDEPWTGLDAESAQAFEVQLALAVERGAAAVVSAHEPHRAKRVASRSLAIGGGLLAEVPA